MPGYYNSTNGRAPCAACPTGSDSTNSSQSTSCKCKIGYYSPTGYSPCYKCSRGTSNFNNGSTSCDVCDIGWYSWTGGKPCAGTYSIVA